MDGDGDVLADMDEFGQVDLVLAPTALNSARNPSYFSLPFPRSVTSGRGSDTVTLGLRIDCLDDPLGIALSPGLVAPRPISTFSSDIATQYLALGEAPFHAACRGFHPFHRSTWGLALPVIKVAA